MTVGVSAAGVGLVYRLRRPLTLARRDRRVPTGGILGSDGRSSFVAALQDVSFSLSAGDRLGIVGPNGAGKTTLLKILYGIYGPTSGRLEVTGRVDALFNIMLGFRREATGRRNIVLRGLINGWTNRQIAARMAEIIEFSELGDFIDAPFKVYSQGMAARLAFAIATSLEPEILLMDEWIGAGDAAFQRKAQRRLEEITSRAGIIVLASHNLGLLKSTCNRILELEQGRVRAFVPAEEWFGRAEAPVRVPPAASLSVRAEPAAQGSSSFRAANIST